MRDNFNVLIILNILVLIFLSLTGGIFFNIITILNLILLLWFKGQDDEKLLKNRNYILVLGIINILLFKVGSGAILLSIYGNLNYRHKVKNSVPVEKKKVVKIDPQIRKIDILLKLGIAMIFIAGFVFATTGWYSLNSIIKIFIFLLVSIIFIGLSKFCEKYIKIKSTIYLYWILGMSFIVMIFFIAGYSSLFGNFFSFVGKGNLLYSAFCCLIVSIVSFITYVKFKEKGFLNLVYAGVFFVLLFVSEYLGLFFEEFLALILPIISIIRIVRFDKEKDINTLSNFSNILLLILGIVYICFVSSYINVLAVIIVTILFIFNLYSYIYINKDSDFNLFASFIAYILLIPPLLLATYNVNYWIVITTVFVTFLYFISLIFDNKKLKNSSLIIADIITILVFVISSSNSVWLPLIVASISMIVCLVCTFIDNLDDYSFEVFIHPVKLSMLLFGLIYILDSYFNFNGGMGYWLSTTLLIYILIYCLSRNKTLTDIYEKFSILAIIVSLLFMIVINNIIISITIFISIVLFYADVNWAKKRSHMFKTFIYVLLLFNIFIGMHAIENSFIAYQSVVETNYFFADIVSIVFFALIAFFHKKDNVKLNISLFAVIIPIISLIENCVDVEWVSIILPSIFIYYLTFILSRLQKKSLTIKNVIGYIGYSYSFILVIFNNNYYVLAYSFIILLISLLLGYFDKTYNALFKVSVIGIIIFILYQLREFWNLIPAWLYLLVFGIVLIVFATYKQLKMVEKNEKAGKKK